MFGDFFIVTDELKKEALDYLQDNPVATNELTAYLQIEKADCFKLLACLEKRRQIKFNFNLRRWEVDNG